MKKSSDHEKKVYREKERKNKGKSNLKASKIWEKGPFVKRHCKAGQTQQGTDGLLFVLWQHEMCSRLSFLGVLC